MKHDEPRGWEVDPRVEGAHNLRPVFASDPPAQDPDWADTSFADETEAAIFSALVMFHCAMLEREQQSPEGHLNDASDINIKYRRLIRDLVEGRVSTTEYLANPEQFE